MSDKPAYLEIADSFFKPIKTMTFAGMHGNKLKIDFETGKVEFDGTHDEAAQLFWLTVTNCYPEAKKAIAAQLGSLTISY